jgi:hypothetical protein
MARALHVGVCLLVIALLPGWAAAQVGVAAIGDTAAPQQRFHFKIDPQTPLKELLPTTPDTTVPLLPWQVHELAQVPEVLFQKPAPAIKLAPRLSANATQSEKDQAQKREAEIRQKGMKEIAHLIARINHLNETGTDHFVKMLRQERPDLAGLPFVMGDACRQSKGMRQAFATEVAQVHASRSDVDVLGTDLIEALPKEAAAQTQPPEGNQFWTRYGAGGRLTKAPGSEVGSVGQTSMRIAALTQILGPEERAIQQGLVVYLAGTKHADATRALARLAVYSPDAVIREPALRELKRRDKAVYADVLLAGLRYPWPAVAKNAAAAIARLECKDLVPKLVAHLDEPDPRAPVKTVEAGKTVRTVREVVRVNHLRSCLLCHPPGNTSDLVNNQGFVNTDLVTGPVPTPNVDVPPPSRGYGSHESPDILVRADATYLRQDFSMMLPVKEAAPWPQEQRFDYLVRTRTVTDEDAAAYRVWLDQQGAGYRPPHQQALLAALRSLTGRDAEPTAKAWRAVLAN